MGVEALLLLQVQDEGPEAGRADIGDLGGKAFQEQEFLQVADGLGDRFDGFGALSLGFRAELVGVN
ncbi:hypothetical protein ACFLU4_00235 [Chloroflexota bacterium]